MLRGTGLPVERWETNDQAISAIRKDAEKQSEIRMATAVD
jgi:hypothetical protein